jgi:hypothetical protein
MRAFSVPRTGGALKGGATRGGARHVCRGRLAGANDIPDSQLKYTWAGVL